MLNFISKIKFISEIKFTKIKLEKYFKRYFIRKDFITTISIKP